MQLVGAYQVLCLLGYLSILRGQKLRAYRGIKHVQKHLRKLLLPAGIGIIAHQMADQRLRHRGVDAVHGHVVSVVGGPAQGQL